MLNDKQIAAYSEGLTPLIKPFYPEKISKVDGTPVLSYGLSGAGYDLTLGTDFRVPITVNKPIDPKKVHQNLYHEVKADQIILEPNNYILGVSQEYLILPNHISGICSTKSTYARVGIFLNVTPLEPGWEGYLTIEVANLSRSPVIIYAREGICQILFFEHADSKPYGDGKYQRQTNIPVLARMKT
jgi:dCTP deaminase